jgi:polysaccharide biosynthesis transport protein
MDDQPQLSEIEAPAKTFTDYWLIAVRRRWTILLPTFLFWLVIWGVSWVIPPTYVSEALILIEQQQVPEQYVVPNVTVSLQDRLQSMTEQILSRTRLEATIDRYHLYQVGKGNSTAVAEDAVDRMRDDISIKLVESAAHPGQLSAFKISYSARSPRLAQQINSELTSLFIQDNLKLQQQLSEGTTAFLESQLADAKAKLEEQEAKVRAFKSRHFGELPSEAEANIQILSGLENQLQNSQRALDSARQQKLYLESLQEQYQMAQSKSGSVAGGDTSNLQVTALENELEALQLQLANARTHLTDEHPDVIALKDKIARTEKLKRELEAQIAAHPTAAKPKTEGVAQPAVTTSMMQTQSQLKALAMEIASEQQRIQDLDSQIASYRSRLSMTPQTEQELTDISRGYEESKANYNSLLQKQNQSQLATSLEQRQQGEQFRILDPPSLPDKPTKPRRLFLSLCGLIAGAALGLGLAALLEMTNHVVRKEEDLRGLTNARVLVGIPHLKEPGEDRFHTLRLRLELGAFSIMALIILAGNLYSFHKH